MDFKKSCKKHLICGNTQGKFLPLQTIAIILIDLNHSFNKYNTYEEI